MGILKQTEPVFKTSQEAREYIKQKEESLQFWRAIRSVDMTEKVEGLRAAIKNAKLALAELEKAERQGAAVCH